MIARKLEPGEIWLSRRNMAVCFEGEFDFEKEQEKAKTEQADPKEDHWGTFLGCPQDPVASLVMNHFTVQFDGHWVKMGGVGGVATLPPYRRGGSIRASMEASLQDLARRDYVFSALYPFSTRFYGQFGFAPAGVTRRWKVPLTTLKLLPAGSGRVRQLFPGEDLSPLLEVYRQVYGGINLGCEREEYDPWLREQNFLSQKVSVFVWEDDRGRPGAFLVGCRERETLRAWPDFGRRGGMLFRDKEALVGLLSFVGKAFIANYRELEFAVPGHLDLMGMLPEITGSQCQSVMNGMVRLVNVPKALELCRCRGAGTVTLEVTDPILEGNNGTFRVAFSPQGNRVDRVDAQPDLSLSIGAASQLVAGVKDAADLPWMEGVAVHGEVPGLEGLFFRKPCHMLDLF